MPLLRSFDTMLVKSPVIADAYCLVLPRNSSLSLICSINTELSTSACQHFSFCLSGFCFSLCILLSAFQLFSV
jgi:hypothetical protein